VTEVEMLRAANEGHVRMIADLAAERDKLKHQLAKAYEAMDTLTERAGELLTERDAAREELGDLLWKIPNH
jgi:uncharacterized coiled-coil DUF342 family protein